MEKNPHAQALGRLGGNKKSEKKSAANRENGKKPKRPRKDSAEINPEPIIQTGQNLQEPLAPCP